MRIKDVEAVVRAFGPGARLEVGIRDGLWWARIKLGARGFDYARVTYGNPNLSEAFRDLAAGMKEAS